MPDPTHTCINTATTSDGSVLPPCPACVAAHYSPFAGLHRPGCDDHGNCNCTGAFRDAALIQSAIAEQLAWRDKRIAQLEAERVHLERGAELLRKMLTGTVIVDYRPERWLEADGRIRK
jgi:hypothetical protein